MAGWEHKTLGEIVQLAYGKPLDPSDRNPNGRYPAYGANGEKDRTDKFYRDQPSIIVGRKGSAGEITLTEAKYWPLDVTYYTEFDRQRYDLKFLYYLLTTLDLPSLAKGVKPGINRNEVYAMPVMVPPLPEQRRIVAILDEAFEGIATAKANAEKNLRNARELFDCHLERFFVLDDDGARKIRLADLCDIKHGYAFDGAHFSVDPSGQYPILLTPGNFSEDGRLQFSERNTKRYASSDIPSAFVLNEGDLVVVMTDLSSKMKILGKPAIVDSPQLLHNQRIGRVVALQAGVVARYLYYFMRTAGFVQGIKRTATGTMVKHTAPARILDAVLSLPSVARQAMTVDALDEAEVRVRVLEEIYRQKGAALDELKMSLLDQAFTGKLTEKSVDKQVAEVA